MADPSETLYATSADGTTVAYQISGSGSLDLVMALDLAVPIDLLFDDPGVTRLARRLGAFSRTVWLERRGKGASGGDAMVGVDDDVWDADLTSVLDALGSDRVVLVGVGDNGPNAISFAATHPERVRALVLVNSYAHYLRENDYLWGIPREIVDGFTASTIEQWGTGAGLELIGPSRSADERFRRWWARCERLGYSPEVLRAMLRGNYGKDVRPMLGGVSVSTLVLHREGNRYIHLGAGRYLADHIPGATLVVLPGDDHIFFLGDTDQLADEIEGFLTGAHQGPEGDVVLAAVLFTDIVNSTRQAAEVGPRAWSQLTDEHDAAVRASLQRHGGREVKTTGDGFLATFDGGARAVRCATEILSSTRALGLHLRAGVHTGDVEVRGNDVAGLAVVIARRVCDLAGTSQILVTETVRGIAIGTQVELEHAGDHTLKGVPGTWPLYAVKS